MRRTRSPVLRPGVAELAALLDSDTSVPGVTQAPLRPEIATIAVPATTSGRNMVGDDFALTAGWGHHGQGDAVMPGQGRVVEHAFTPEEFAAMDDTLLPSATPPSTCISTVRPSGETFPPPSGPTSSAATRSSRNGCPTASAIS